MTTRNNGLWRFFTAIVTLTIIIFSILSPFTATITYAAWNFPYTELIAEAGIVMDADTGAILFQKNADTPEYPASITKVLTALVVLDNCQLTDQVTFSHDDVYNVDSGSSNAQIEEGDVLTVEDCLYALLLKSANEAANALACHVAGSREAFAEMMNEKARELGCTSSHFTNPSGLFDENHYTTAHDMALIGIEAMHNEAFMSIDSALSHKLAGTIRNPGGLTVYMEHKMHRDDTKFSDPRVVAGKTGYTKDSGNTLITMASSNGRNLVAVVLKDKNPGHYTDTKALLDLGFNTTENQPVDSSLFNTEDIKNRLVADTIVAGNCQASDLSVKKDMYVSLPIGSTQEGLTYSLNYNLLKSAPTNTVAEIMYQADGITVGRYYVEKEPTVAVATSPQETITEEEKTVAVAVTSVSVIAIAGIVGFAIFGSGAAIGIKKVHDQHTLDRHMKQRRTERLKDIDMSEDEFMQVLEARRSAKSRANAGHRTKPKAAHMSREMKESVKLAKRRNISRGRREQRQ